MPTKRRKILHHRTPGIGVAAIEAWRQGDWHGLNSEFGIGPWMLSPFDVHGPVPPSWATGEEIWLPYWPKAWQLRTALIALAGEPGQYDRHGQPLGASS